MPSHIFNYFFSFVFTCCSRTIHLFPLLHSEILGEQKCEAKLQVYALQATVRVCGHLSSLKLLNDSSRDETVIEPVQNSFLAKN